MNFYHALKVAKNLVKRYHVIAIISKNPCSTLSYTIMVDDSHNITFQEEHIVILGNDGVRHGTERIVPFDSVKENSDLRFEFQDGWTIALTGNDFRTTEDIPKKCCHCTPSVRHEISEYTWRTGLKTPVIEYFVQCRTCGKRSESSMSYGWACKQWNEGVQDE